MRIVYYPRDALRSAIFAVATCPSVCLSHSVVFSKRQNL